MFFFSLVMIRKCVTKLHNMGTHWKPVSAASGEHLFCTAEPITGHSVLNIFFFLMAISQINCQLQCLPFLEEDVLFQTKQKHSPGWRRTVFLFCAAVTWLFSPPWLSLPLSSHICLQIFFQQHHFFSYHLMVSFVHGRGSRLDED